MQDAEQRTFRFPQNFLPLLSLPCQIETHTVPVDYLPGPAVPKEVGVEMTGNPLSGTARTPAAKSR